MMIEEKSSAKIVIVGAGFAGASTAWWLRHHGEKDILVVERESAAGAQASGQNAAMARQATNDPVTCRLLTEGVRFFENPPRDFRHDRALLRRAGSALVGPREKLQRMADILGRLIPTGEFEVTTAAGLSSTSYLKGMTAPAALITHSDGFIDLRALIEGFLDGTPLLTRCALLSATRVGDEWALRTTRGPVTCRTLAVAAGAWANPCAKKIGVKPLSVRPTRRHLFETVARRDFSQEAPFVWDITTECYVRPNGEGRLFASACDQDPCDPDQPLLPDPKQIEVLNNKIAHSFPALTHVPWQRYWPGTRTLTPDGRFIIGPDPAVENLFWVAGLGGHGVTTSPAVGRIAAESILGIAKPPEELRPARFVQEPA